MWAIDEILEQLKDGKWHNLGEITKKTSLHEIRAQTIISFLSSYNFLEFDKEGRKAKLHPLTVEFINEIQCIEKDEDIRASSLR